MKLDCGSPAPSSGQRSHRMLINQEIEQFHVSNIASPCNKVCALRIRRHENNPHGCFIDRDSNDAGLCRGHRALCITGCRPRATFTCLRCGVVARHAITPFQAFLRRETPGNWGLANYELGQIAESLISAARLYQIFPSKDQHGRATVDGAFKRHQRQTARLRQRLCKWRLHRLQQLSRGGPCGLYHDSGPNGVSIQQPDIHSQAKMTRSDGQRSAWPQATAVSSVVRWRDWIGLRRRLFAQRDASGHLALVLGQSMHWRDWIGLRRRLSRTT